MTIQGEAPKFTVVTHPYAQYPLLRAALENSSAAVWLLSPSPRDERLTRRFRLLYEDARNRDAATRLIGQPDELRMRRLERIEPTLTARGISPGKVKKRPGFEESSGNQVPSSATRSRLSSSGDS